MNKDVARTTAARYGIRGKKRQDGGQGIALPRHRAVGNAHETRPLAGERKAKFVYASSNLNVAIWAAELAVGDGLARIYVVEAIGTVENDPNLTDKKFPGNPTNSIRARDGFKVVAEVMDWQGHSLEEIKAAREKVDLALKNGAPIIES